MAKLKFEHLFLSTHGLGLLCFCQRLWQCFNRQGLSCLPKTLPTVAQLLNLHKALAVLFDPPRQFLQAHQCRLPSGPAQLLLSRVAAPGPRSVQLRSVSCEEAVCVLGAA